MNVGAKSMVTGCIISVPERSECLTCTFRASCCSARLSQAQVPAFPSSSVRDMTKKGGGSKGGPPALQGSMELVAGGGCLRCYGIWNFL